MKKICFPILIAMFLIFVCSFTASAETTYYTKSAPVTYTLIERTTLVNNGTVAAKDITLSLPLMDSSMPVYQELVSEQFTPYPNRIVSGNYGDNGSRDAIYHIDYLAAGKTIVLEQRYTITCYSLDYTYKAADVPAQYSKKPLYIYTEPSLFVESNEQEIINFAQKVLEQGITPYLISKNLFSQVNLYMTYKDGANANKGALNAVRTAEGICEDYTDLYVASLRSLGISARQMTGYLYIANDPNQQQYVDAYGNVDLSYIGHSWAEFYLPTVEWVFADPTFTYTVNIGGKNQKFVDWDFFSKIPDARRYIFLREGSASEPRSYFNSTGGSLSADYAATLVAGNQSLPFTDLVGHWSESAVMYLYNQPESLVKGVGDNKYGVNIPITRAQLAVFLQRVKKAPKADLTFPDVSSNHWAAQAIAAAKERGWLVGYADGTFRPDQQLTRAEMATVLVRSFNIKSGDAAVNFKDLGRPGYVWADASIMILASNGLAGGDGNGNFMPQKNVTRAEFAVFLSNILQSLK